MNSNAYDNTRFQNGDLLALIASFVLMGILIYLVPVPLLRIPLGTFCIFYAPGYALLAALYPSKKEMSQGQRFSAAVGLSVVVTGLLTLAVTYSVGTTLNSSFWILVAWVVSMVFMTRYRRSLLSPSERFVPRLNIQLTAGKNGTPLQKFLFLAQVVATLLLILAAGRLLWGSAQTQPQFSEFYLLGKQGLAAEYPEQSVVGTPITTTVGIVNHEGLSTSYELTYQINDGNRQALTSMVLDHGQEWQSEVTIDPLPSPGVQKVTFLLWDTKEHVILHSLHLWVELDNQSTNDIKND